MSGDAPCKTCGFGFDLHGDGHWCAMYTAADEGPTVTALRSLVSELRANLEVAVSGLDRIMRGKYDGLEVAYYSAREDRDIARATLNTIRAPDAQS